MLIDQGSELSFVSERLVRQLNIQRQRSSIEIVGIGGHKASRTRGLATITLKSKTIAFSTLVNAHILSTLTTVLPSFVADKQEWPHLSKLRLADPDYLTPRTIDVIIGADYYGRIIKPNIIKYTQDAPIAQLSVFGWLVLGPVHTSMAVTKATHLTVIQTSNQQLDELLTKFWRQEEPPTLKSSQLTPEELECEQHFCTTHSRDSTGRFIVRIPFKVSPSNLGNSYSTAHKCLQRMLNRFKRDDRYRQLYMQFMMEYEKLGHMARISESTRREEFVDCVEAGEMTLAHDASASGGLRVSSGLSRSQAHSVPVYYLPHHGVLKPDSLTTKLRVVFNGSATSSSGLSLNDITHTGPNLLLNIIDVLIWVRIHRHLFATDITKMYRQIQVHPDDWHYQRILWVDSQLNEVQYNLTTVTYGTKSAPYLAVRTLIQLAQEEGHRFPLAVPSITHGRYVDDIFGGADSEEQLTEIAQQLIQLCHAGGFPLAKWHSTNQQLFNDISQTELTDSSITFDDCKTKILGIKWLPHEDRFQFTSMSAQHQNRYSKRIVLSEVAQIFDPLGFASPVVTRAKMLLQELWLQKINWDDPLPSQLKLKWLNIRKDLTSLAKLSIPRWFNTLTDSSVTLHGFSDASQFAMAAVVYLVTDSSSTGAKPSLIISKTKVAPIKRLTIPRLELSAALLLSRLIYHVKTTLPVNVSKVYLWTDSQVSLTWIKSHPSRWKDYVRNRVAQIQEITSDALWKYIPGTHNPADCASRGISAEQLESHELWWTGPPWLTKDEEYWPKQPEDSEKLSHLESRPGVSLMAQAPPQYHWDLIYKYSSLARLFRITSLCFRFVSRLKKEIKLTPVSAISATDMEKSRIFWVKATQATYFTAEIKALRQNVSLPPAHPFTRLTAFIDHEGIIRVGGRLDNSMLAYDAKHQAILPSDARLSELLIRHAHQLTMHGGTQLTLAHLRQLYWIIGGRKSVKSHILKCVTCARQRGLRAQQLMGQLPTPRVSPSRAFSHTGIDYAGPLTLKTWAGRGAKTHKGWICVFVCFSSSAVHLEVVSDYSTSGFISAYRRFISRRGIPHSLYSDCGTNFLGAETQLKQLFSQTTRENHEIASLFAQDRTRWNFNPPAAPHMGGKWEAVVKSLKFHIKRTVGETLMTFEETSTLLTQIEAILNSRPLEPLSDDPDDISALTPGHFLIGTALNAVPEPSLSDLSTSRLSRWQFLQQRVQQFWTQWSSHYLQRQQAISKWHHPRNEIKVGSLVLISDERLPPIKWPLARVISLQPGKDGLTRVVTLKTATTTLVRPIAKLALLPGVDQDISAAKEESSTSC